MAAEEFPAPKFSFTNLGLNYITDLDLGRTIDPKYWVKYDWQLNNFLLEITVCQGEHVSHHIVPIHRSVNSTNGAQVYFISFRIISDIVFQTCGRSQRLKLLEMVENEYQTEKTSFLHGEYKMILVGKMWDLMTNFAGTDKRVSKYIACQSFMKTCDHISLYLWMKDQIQTAIDNALKNLIKHASWQWPYFEHPTSEYKQSQALDDIAEIEGAIMYIRHHSNEGKYKINVTKESLGDYIKAIATFYQKFPVFNP